MSLAVVVSIHLITALRMDWIIGLAINGFVVVRIIGSSLVLLWVSTISTSL